MKVRLLFLIFVLITQQLKSSELSPEEDRIIRQAHKTDQSEFCSFLQLHYSQLYYSDCYSGTRVVGGSFELSRPSYLKLQKMVDSFSSLDKKSVNTNIAYSHSRPDVKRIDQIVTAAPLWHVWLKRVGKSSWMPRTGWIHRCWSKLGGNRTDEEILMELLSEVYFHVSSDKQQNYKDQCAELKQVKALRSQPSFLQDN